jgi:glyceraldehyde 3-phosphate dehydrogenase
MTFIVGVNGFGRIGKCLVLQILESKNIELKLINTSLEIESIGRYLSRDTTQGKRKIFFEILENNYVKINRQIVKITNYRNPEEIDWENEEVECVFETTGAFLTKEKLEKHKVKKVILSSPPKNLNEIKMICYGANHKCRINTNDKIISAASCTTNCITPFLYEANKFGKGIEEASFITIHSATSSQSVVDTSHDKKRTNRSIFNNIIPHTTGASNCIDIILSELKGKIVGTSVRVPISVVSMLDLNIRFKEDVKLIDILSYLENKDNFLVSKDKCVSSDFIGSECPTIIDYHHSHQINSKSIKFTLWYDNEWSYVSQMIKLL